MEQINFTTKLKKYTHLSEKDRYKIEALLESKKSAQEIALLLGRDRSTIHREVKRGMIKRIQSDLTQKKKYRANVAQRDYPDRCQNRERSLNIGKDKRLEEYIRRKITRERFSPDAIIGQIKAQGLQFKGMISTKTLYNYIDAGIFSGISHKDLWEKSKQKKRSYNTVVRITTKNRRSRSIEERPKEANDRTEYGHWEGDSVKSARQAKAGLLTLTERKTRQQMVIKLPDATHEAMQQAFDKLEKRFGSQFKIKFKSIENHNRMIRRFVPKGYDIGGFSDTEIKTVEDWMNNYPRRILGYNTPNEAAQACLQGNSDLGLSVAV